MELKIVIGSWNAYTNKNEKSSGSEWIDLTKYDTWDAIEEELKKQGFDVDGADEELFIQDMNFEIDGLNSDYTHPRYLFNILKTSGALEDEDLYKEMIAYTEVVDWDEFCDLVEKRGRNWDDDIIFGVDCDLYDFGYDRVKESIDADTFKFLESYIDFEHYANDLNAKKTSTGVIEFLNE